jgi:hydrophobic/amphiphilic exporter-1 (mainly G- bacteria), HAE1 family
MIASLYSEDNRYDETFLSNYAIINLQNPLARLPGVGQVQVLGAGPYSMRIWLHPVKLKAYGVTVLDVQNAIKNQNVQVATGQLGGPPVPSDQIFQFTVQTLGRLSDVTQFEDIIVKTVPPESSESQTKRTVEGSQAASVVRIKDIAKVDLGQEVYSTFSGLSGKRAAQMNVYTLPGANALRVSQEVRELMSQMSRKFPQGLKYVDLLDTSTFIKDSIHGVYQALIEAGMLVLLVIMLFLQNYRAMLVPATTVPVTIIGAFAAMALLGFTVNLMTLFALILAIGIVVDDAIVIVENASHYIETGLSPKEAAIKAMSELTGPVLGITLVLTAVFLPASFLPGITGQMFRQFALVIASTAIISALNALTLKPAQCALYLKPRPQDRQLNWFYRGFNAAYQAVEDVYIGLVRLIARHSGTMACVFLAVVGAAVFLFAHYPTTLMALEDQGYCIVVARLTQGASQPRVQEVARSIDRVFGSTSGIKGWVTIGGFSALDRAKISNMITVFEVYDNWGERPPGFSQMKLISELTGKFSRVRSASFAVLPPSPIPGLGNTFGFQMMVEDRRDLGLRELQKVMQSIMGAAQDKRGFLRTGFTTFSDDSPQLYIDIDRTMVNSLGVPVNDVFQTLQTYLRSTYVNLFNKYNQSFQVRVQAGENYRRTQQDISNLYVRNKDGQMAPLGAMLDIRPTLGSELVTRYNLYPAAAIMGIANPGYSSGQAMGVMGRLANNSNLTGE